MDLDAFRWLLTEDGQALLLGPRGRTPTAPATRCGPPTALRRDGATPEHVAAALTQVELRAPGGAEVRRRSPRRMYFTPDGLEQATRLPVADAPRRPAARPPRRRRVVDLGCGIGGDLVAFARAGLTAAGVDLDPVRVAVAARQPRGARPRRRGQVADATDVDTAAVRRGLRRPGPSYRPRAARSTSTTGRRPGPSSRRCCAGDACVKVAPGHPARRWCPTGVEAEWVSDHGEVKEAALWSRPAGHRPRAARP